MTDGQDVDFNDDKTYIGQHYDAVAAASDDDGDDGDDRRV
jgi:hypothetical protein